MPMWAIGGGMALGAAGSAIGSYFGNKAQSAAAQAALKQQMALADQAGAQFERNTGAAKNIIGQGSAAAQQQYSGYLGQARGDIQGGYGAAMGQLGQGYGMAAGALSPLQQLQGYGQQATQAVNLGDPYANFQADPGYQFRQQQGEQAINRAASAAGGRISGATLKALSGFNQDLASQEYGNFAQRGLALRGQNMQAALAAQQNQMGLAGLGYGAQGQLAGYGMQYGQGMSGLQSQQAQQLAQQQMMGGQYMSGLTYGTAEQQAAMNMQRAQMYGGLAGNTMAAQTGPVPYAGGTAAALGQTAAQAGQSIAQLGMMYGGTGGTGRMGTDANGNYYVDESTGNVTI